MLPRPPPPTLLQALVSLARTAIDNPSDLPPQQALLTHLLRAHLPSHPHLHAPLHARLLDDDPYPEEAHFRRARQAARPYLPPRLPPPLFDLSVELLAALHRSPFAAVRVQLQCRTRETPGVSFRVVLGATRTHADTVANASRLATFLAAVSAYAPTHPLETEHPVVFAVTVLRAATPPDAAAAPVPAPSREKCLPPAAARRRSGEPNAAPNAHLPTVHFDRLRDRIAVRLAALAAEDLYFCVPLRSDVIAPYTFPSTIADGGDAANEPPTPVFSKQLRSPVITHHVALSHTSRILSRAFSQQIASRVHAIPDTSAPQTVRAIYLTYAPSASQLPPTPTASVQQISPALHLTVSASHTGHKSFHVDLHAADQWDAALLRPTLFRNLSTSLLIFRFDSPRSLARAIADSKIVSDQFPGLTSDPSRTLYVDTSTVNGDWEAARDTIVQVAADRRLFPPNPDADILFEAVNAVETERDIVVRAQLLPTILNADIRGPARPYLEEIVHILNREIDDAQALVESEEVSDFLLRLRHPIHTKVSLGRKTEAGSITVSRGDATGFSTASMNLSHLMHEADYRDYRDVTSSQPFTVDVQLNLGGPGAELATSMGRFSRKWGVISKIAKMVCDERKLLLAVADERKTVLARGSGRFMTAVGVTVLGGGLNEFLHGKMIRNCVEAVRADRNEDEQIAVRILLRLVPGLVTTAAKGR